MVGAGAKSSVGYLTKMGHNHPTPVPSLCLPRRHPVDLSRRTLIHTGLLSTLAPALDRMVLPVGAPAGAPATTHGPAPAAGGQHWLSMFGVIKYPAGF